MNAQSHPIRVEDQHIGKQIKARRETFGLTQSNIANALGISFQQLQKYETGANHTSGYRLCYLAKILCCGPDYFFEGIGVAIETERMASREEAVMLGYMRVICLQQCDLSDDMNRRWEAAGRPSQGVPEPKGTLQ